MKLCLVFAVILTSCGGTLSTPQRDDTGHDECVPACVYALTVGEIANEGGWHLKAACCDAWQFDGNAFDPNNLQGFCELSALPDGGC
jgi:hypothetical protein